LFQRDPILISLSPTSLRIGIIAGSQVARVERCVLETKFDEAWNQSLRPFDDLLRNALQSINARPGTNALVLYHSPRSVAEVFSVPGAGNAAAQAVELYLNQNLPGAGRNWLTTYHLIADGTSDEHGGIAGSFASTTSGAATGNVRTTALTYADFAEDVDALAGWVRRAGLNIAGVMPTKAAMLRAGLQPPYTTDEQPGNHVDAVPQVFIHLGEHAMTLTAWQGSRLLLARCADVGYSLLIDAVYSSAKSLAKSDHLTREYATRTLFAAGLPQRDQMMDDALKLSGESVLPLSQPALQRYLVEVRQTLRFGMIESDVARAQVHLVGPGAGIPGLADALSTMLELNIAVADYTSKPGESLGDEQVGDLALALQLRNVHGWFIPGTVQVSQASRRMATSVRAGAMSAALILAALATKSYVSERALRTVFADLQQQSETIDAQAAARKMAQQKSQDLEAVLSISNASIGARPNWHAVLAMLSTDMPAGAELLDVSSDYTSAESKGAPTISLRGRTRQHANRTADPVSSFLDALNRSPLVESARVVSSRTEPTSGEREFMLSVVLKAINVPGIVETPEAGDPFLSVAPAATTGGKP